MHTSMHSSKLYLYFANKWRYRLIETTCICFINVQIKKLSVFSGAAGGASGGYGTYRSKRDISNIETHSINSLDHPETPLVWMESVHQQLTSSACQNLLVCHLSQDTNKQKFLTSAMDKINKLHTTTEDAQEALRIAIAEGKEGKDCFKIYPKCHLSLNEVDKLLGTLGME